MTDPGKLRVAGAAGGVGTSVLARILDADDLGLDTDGADIIVARNDYRSAKTLVGLYLPQKPGVIVVLIEEPRRSLTHRDFEEVTGIGERIISVDLNPAIARADDAGLLDVDWGVAYYPKAAVLFREEVLSARSAVNA